MRQPHIFQIGSTNYTTREYCQSKGITDDYAIKKIQWRINTYIHNHTNPDTTEELIRLVSLSNVTSNAAKEIDNKDQCYVLTPSGRRYHRKCSQYHEPSITCQDAQKGPLSDWRQSPLTPIQDLTARLDRQEETSKTPDGIRPWQGTKKEREIAQNLLQQSKWMEHNEKWLNEAGILPNAEDIQKANKPYDPAKIISANPPETNTPKIEETNITNAPDRLRAAYRSLKLYSDAIEKKKTIQSKIDTLEAELKDAQKEVEKWSTNAAALLQDV